MRSADGVDMILGGASDDIITDISFEDNLQGGFGNDVINGFDANPAGGQDQGNRVNATPL